MAQVEAKLRTNEVRPWLLDPAYVGSYRRLPCCQPQRYLKAARYHAGSPPQVSDGLGSCRKRTGRRRPHELLLLMQGVTRMALRKAMPVVWPAPHAWIPLASGDDNAVQTA